MVANIGDDRDKAITDDEDIHASEKDNVDLDPYTVENLHTLFAEQYRKQHINYKKFYHVSNVYKRKGERLKDISLFIGMILLFVLGGVITGRLGQDIVEEGIITSLHDAVFVFSAIAIIVTVFEVKKRWLIKATRYHKYGQVHQSLFTDIEFILQTKFQRPNVDINELKRDYRRIVKRKNQLNKVSPHISDRLYKDLDIRIDIDPTANINDFEIVAEVRENNNDDPDSTEPYKLDRYNRFKEMIHPPYT